VHAEKSATAGCDCNTIRGLKASNRGKRPGWFERQEENVKIGYWVLTVMLCLLLAFGAYMDFLHGPQVVAGTAALGYPEYFLNIDGTAKILAVFALLVPLPGFTGLREWAYAGLVFLTIGATWSHIARHQSPVLAIATLIITVASYGLWRATRGTTAATARV
jgi:hypothetical protein